METNELIDKFLWRNKKRKTKIAVIGDTMIDEYFYVDANRVSPEFPVPVMRADSDKPSLVIPGGAGNTAMQFKHWNVDLQLFSLLDDNTYSVLFENNIKIDNCVMPDNEIVGNTPCHCPVKRRFYQNKFPLCRFDIEQPNCYVKDTLH